MSCPNPSVPDSAAPYVDVTTTAQCQRTASNTTLNIVGESGTPWVAPHWPLKWALDYPTVLATMVRRPQ